MIIQDKIAEWKVKDTVRKLKKLKEDLNNDESAVNKTNKEIGDLTDDLNRFIGASAAAQINAKLEALREPSQGNDSDLANARHYIDKEISYLNKGLDDYEKSQCSTGSMGGR